MKKSFSRKEIRNIRKKAAIITGKADKKEIIQLSIALPEPCDQDTLDYAYDLIRELKKERCKADISFILSFPKRLKTDKPYEVVHSISLSTPCIRVYHRKVPKPKRWWAFWEKH